MDEIPKIERQYQPAPSKPDFFDQALRDIGGVNPFGESIWKVSWGWDLKTFRNDNPQALKYPGPFLSRWILEKWVPASFCGTLAEWERSRYFWSDDGKRIDGNGPFPAKGMHVMKMPLIAAGVSGTKPGDYIPCSTEVLIMVEMLQQEANSFVPNCYTSAKLYADLQQKMADQELDDVVERDHAVAEWDEYVLTRQGEMNKNPIQFFRPGASLWTPEGERAI